MSDEEQYEPLEHVANILEKVAADYRALRAENEKLRAALAEIGYDFSTNRDEAAIVARKALR